MYFPDGLDFACPREHAASTAVQGISGHWRLLLRGFTGGPVVNPALSGKSSGASVERSPLRVTYRSSRTAGRADHFTARTRTKRLVLVRSAFGTSTVIDSTGLPLLEIALSGVKDVQDPNEVEYS